MPNSSKTQVFSPKLKSVGQVFSSNLIRSLILRKSFFHPPGGGGWCHLRGDTTPGIPGGGGNLHTPNENQSTTQKLFIQKPFTKTFFKLESQNRSKTEVFSPKTQVGGSSLSFQLIKRARLRKGHCPLPLSTHRAVA